MLFAHVGARRSTSLRAPSIARGYRQPWRNLLTLAIETSCDDTAVAILEQSSLTEDIRKDYVIHKSHVKTYSSARLLFNEKITARNTGLGGIHPIEALESHEANLANLVSKAIGHLPDASTEIPTAQEKTKHIQVGNGKARRLPDFVSVTRGPGMRSNLTCGLNTAKGLAAAWQVPLLGVHHMQAHALTPRLVNSLEANVDVNRMDAGQVQPQFPFLTLLISGGHTMLLHSKDLNDHEILATTRDIAIGDALDKCGRTILPANVRAQAKDTAFAKYLSDYAFQNPDTFESWPLPRKRRDEIAKPNNDFGWQLQAPLADTKDLAFSFTSISSSTERIFQERKELLDRSTNDGERLLLARTALGTAFEHLASRTIIALGKLRDSQQDISTLVVSGGVAANAFLRYFLRAMLDVRGFNHVKLLFPPPWLCTDNAAMIAWCGIEMFEAGFRSELDIRALRKWSLDPAAHDGGILGVGGWKKLE